MATFFDVTQRNQVNRKYSKIENEVGQIDILVNQWLELSKNP